MHRGTTGGVVQAVGALRWLLFFIHQYFFWAEGSICLKLLCLHIAGVIYLFDYCPASWHVPVIDGNCVPGDTGLLLSPVAYGLKDSSAERTVTLCSSSLSHPPLHLLTWLLLSSAWASNFPCFLQRSGYKWDEWPFAGSISVKAQRFVWRMSARAVVQRWKAQAPLVEPELAPLSDIPALSSQSCTSPSSPTMDARRGQRTELSREQFVCKWRDLTDEGAATQKRIQLALWKLRNRDTIYPRCVASQCLCSCNAS